MRVISRVLGSLILLAAAALAQTPLRVVATTTFVGDAVNNVAGGRVQLTVLMPPGIDPHAFQPTPRDAALLANADVIFANGLGLEDEFLPGLLRKSKTSAPIVMVSEGAEMRIVDEETYDGRSLGDGDPHVWLNPLNVKSWAQNIERVLIELDPGRSNAYRGSSAEYQQNLTDLDRWAKSELHTVKWDERKLVTDHDSLGHLASQYGFEVVATVIPGYSTGAEPSAQDLARIEDAIREQGVKAIFVGEGLRADLAERVAMDTGVRVVPLTTCALKAGEDYIPFMANLIEKMTGALK